MSTHNDRLKSPKKVVPTKPAKWKFVSQFPISEYRCGLRAGQRVRLKHDITVLDNKGQPTGKVEREGEIWSLLRGSKEPPVVVWLRQTDGAPHTCGGRAALCTGGQVLDLRADSRETRVGDLTR